MLSYIFVFRTFTVRAAPHSFREPPGDNAYRWSQLLATLTDRVAHGDRQNDLGTNAHLEMAPEYNAAEFPAKNFLLEA